MTLKHDPRVSIAVAQLSVVESTETSDPVALLFALQLLARWAVRAHRTPAPEPPTSNECATYAPEK